MSRRKTERRREREAEYEAQDRARLTEEARKDALSMYERIEESDACSSVRDILHRMAEKLGLK